MSVERFKVAMFAAAQSVWTAIRALGRATLGAERLDRVMGRTGLRAFKSQHWLSRKKMPDGNDILYRPHDQCILDEVYVRELYSGGAGIRSGQTVVDVGAHIGVFSLLAARKVGPTGRVIAFEPSPQTLELLRRNLTFNRLSWVKLYPVAVAETEGTADFFVADASAGNPVTDTLSAVPGRKSVPVRLRRLDDVLDEEGASVVDHLKIDVEGAEMRVLDGAPKTLARARRLVMEVHPPRVNPADVRGRLEAAGFSCRFVTESGGGVILEAVRAP